MPERIYVQPADDLQKIFDSAQPGDVLQLSPGLYRQKTLLKTPGITLIGAGADKTVIIYDDYALKKDELGREYNTFRTYTMAVCADQVTMRDLAIVNDALNPREKGQEVALSVLGDGFLMENCRLSSTQDTLFAGPLPDDLIARYDGFLRDELRAKGPGRQVYRNCLIEGSVDYIFGCADALFEDCEIRNIYDGRTGGFIAAPAHALEQERGFLFRNCRITCGESVAPGSIYLARPWRDFGLCRFENCVLGAHIHPDGFDKWNDTERDKTARFYETPAVEGRVQWINR
ncbi:MAG: pectin esterase [Clostridia bacterium]|nr:pectin esterase [Clostridia bacterium]